MDGILLDTLKYNIDTEANIQYSPSEIINELITPPNKLKKKGISSPIYPSYKNTPEPINN